MQNRQTLISTHTSINACQYGNNTFDLVEVHQWYSSYLATQWRTTNNTFGKNKQIHSSVKFTVKWSSKSVSFLVTKAIVDNEGCLATNLYVKPTDTHHYTYLHRDTTLATENEASHTASCSGSTKSAVGCWTTCRKLRNLRAFELTGDIMMKYSNKLTGQLDSTEMYHYYWKELKCSLNRSH